MEKVKLAICMKDLEYQARFVNCIMNHYQYLYEVHAFTSLEELNASDFLAYAVIISEDYSIQEMTGYVEKGKKLLFLTEDTKETKSCEEGAVSYTCKYQEVYKIAELIQRISADGKEAFYHTGMKNDKKRTGVYSLSKEKYQIPIVALMAETYGEKEKVLVLDLQSHSGLAEKASNHTHMGLEDLLSMAMTGNYSKNRILECIVQRDKWDYIYPVKNIECLVEGNMALYEDIMEIMENDFGYQRIIINFGTTFCGELEMMDHCDNFYLLCGKEAIGEWRESAFLDVLERREKKELLQKLSLIEVQSVPSVTVTWESLMEKWRWSSMGENLRNVIWEEDSRGSVM